MAPQSHRKREGKVLSHSATTTGKYSPIHIHFQRGIWGLDDIEEELLWGKDFPGFAGRRTFQSAEDFYSLCNSSNSVFLILWVWAVSISLPFPVGLICLCVTLIQQQLGASRDEGENWLHLLATGTSITLPERDWVSCCQQTDSASRTLAVTAATSHFPLLQGMRSPSH